MTVLLAPQLKADPYGTFASEIQRTAEVPVARGTQTECLIRPAATNILLSALF